MVVDFRLCRVALNDGGAFRGALMLRRLVLVSFMVTMMPTTDLRHVTCRTRSSCVVKWHIAVKLFRFAAVTGSP